MNVRRCIVCSRWFDADIEIECCGGSYAITSRTDGFLKMRLVEQKLIDEQIREKHIADELKKAKQKHMQVPERLEEEISPVVFISTVIVEKKKKKKWRKTLDREIRQLVLRRDKRRCTECHSKEGLHVHHVKARKDGGGDEIDNLTTLCELCHAEKHRGEPIYNLMVKSVFQQISI